MEYEDVAIKTTDIHKEGMEIIDFLYKTYNVSFENQTIDEFKAKVLQHTYTNGCYWIVCSDLYGKKDILVASDYVFPKKRCGHDDVIRFDNFLDFKKYIEDVQDNEINQRKNEINQRKNNLKKRKNMNLINAILDFILGRRYYANIVNIRGRSDLEICSYIFKTKAEANKHKSEIDTTLSFLFIETITFRSKKIKIENETNEVSL
jgi:hypothetical protein